MVSNHSTLVMVFSKARYTKELIMRPSKKKCTWYLLPPRDEELSKQGEHIVLKNINKYQIIESSIHATRFFLNYTHSSFQAAPPASICPVSKLTPVPGWPTSVSSGPATVVDWIDCWFKKKSSFLFQIPSRGLTYPPGEKENHLQNAIFGGIC